ncbi:MAG TPA: GNAT family N-acetyltransferase [Pyrinomonadaceae bacterium]|nr:GNAT family N-acetyltransferase [Pyrinomonadaceae bacterium]
MTIMFSHRVDSHSELRTLEERHAELLFVLVEQNRERHPEIPQLYSLEDARIYIKRDLALFAENKGLGIGIWYQGDLAGVVRYHEIDWTNRSTELGYWLGAAFEGKGLVTTACRVMIDHAFNELGLNRVVISCASENQRSRAIAVNLGFTQEGILRQSDWLKDGFVDQVVYGILACEWRGMG